MKALHNSVSALTLILTACASEPSDWARERGFLPVGGPSVRGPAGHGVSGSDEYLEERLAAAQRMKSHPALTWPQVGSGMSPDFDPRRYTVEGPIRSEQEEEDEAAGEVELVGDGEVSVTRQALTLAKTTVNTRDTGWGNPHEPTVSLGNAQMLVATRAGLTIVSKSNRLIYESDSANFFSGVTTHAEEMYDCRAVYAPSQQRHIYMCLQNWLKGSTGGCPNDSDNCTGQIVLAVSKNAYPTRPSDFWLYKFSNPDTDGNPNTRNDGDFPYLGVTNDMLIVSQKIREGVGASYRWTDSVQVLSLAELAAGGAISSALWTGPAFQINVGTPPTPVSVEGVIPAIHWGATGTAFMVSRDPRAADSMLVWAITNPFTTPALSVATVSGLKLQNASCGSFHCSEAQKDIPGDGLFPRPVWMHDSILSNAEGIFRSPSWRNGKLWFVRDQTQVLNGVRKSVVRYGEIDTGTLAVVADNWLGLADASYGRPGIAGTSSNDALIGFVHTSSAVFPTLKAVTLDHNNVLSQPLAILEPLIHFAKVSPALNIVTYDIGVSVAAEPSEDAAWLVTQTPIRTPANDDDWNAGLVMAKVGGVKKFDLTVPRYIHASAGDLAKTAISDVTSVSRGATLTATVRVENFGDKASSADTLVSMYLSTDTLINSNDTYIGSGLLPSIPTGSSGSFDTLTVSGTVPSNMRRGNYRIGFIIIVNVNEYETTNNTGWNDKTTQVL